MRNTALFVFGVREFAKAMQQAATDYDREMQKIERMQGSREHEDRQQAAQAKRDAAEAAARQEAARRFGAALQGMREAAAGRAMQPPTDEQLRILELLQMRETLTDADIMQAYNSLSGCPAACGVLREIAQKHGSLSGAALRGADLDSAFVDISIDTLERSAKKLMQGGGSYVNVQTVAGEDEKDIICRMAAFPNTVTERRGVQQVTYNNELAVQFCEYVD